jgi:hypothetical protein
MANKMGLEEIKMAIEAIRSRIRRTEDEIVDRRNKRSKLIQEGWRPKTQEDGDRNWEKIYQLEEEINLLQHTLFEDDHEEEALMEQFHEAYAEEKAQKHFGTRTMSK